jgi:hypothetical protein
MSFFENYEKWGGKDAIIGACDFDGHGTYFIHCCRKF